MAFLFRREYRRKYEKINLLEYIGKQIGLICSMVLIVVRILDWFNPYMDFMGHSYFVLYLLCACSISLGLYGIFGRKEEPKGRRRKV